MASGIYTTLHYEAADGPSAAISTSLVTGLLADGTITEKTLVWTEGMEGWKALEDARPLFADMESSAGNIVAQAAIYTALHYETPDGPSKEISSMEAARLMADDVITKETMVWAKGMVMGGIRHSARFVCWPRASPIDRLEGTTSRACRHDAAALVQTGRNGGGERGGS